MHHPDAQLIKGQDSDEELEALICDCLDLLLPTLPAEQASILRAVERDGALPQAVADSLGLSLSAVNTQLAQGRQGVKDRFAEMRMICTGHSVEGCGCHPISNKKI